MGIVVGLSDLFSDAKTGSLVTPTSTGKENSFIYFCKEFLSTWGSIILQLLITLLPINVLGATKYLDPFPVHPFLECNIAKWGNQKPVSLEEIGRAPGHRGWNETLAPGGKLGTPAWHDLIPHWARKTGANLIISAPQHLPK